MRYRIGIWNDNAPHIKHYSEQVGALVVNFGFLEYISYLWIACLQKDTALIEVAANMPLGHRISLIEKLVMREFGAPQKKEVIALWQQVRQLSELRNTVCHNPYIFGWTRKPGKSDPDIALTASIKSAIKKKRGAMPGLKEIRSGIENTGAISNRLFNLILEHVEAMAGRKAPR